MVGPLTGTPANNSSDWTTICLNLAIPYAAGVGHGHGFWGAYLKHAGCQGIILTGKSKTLRGALCQSGNARTTERGVQDRLRGRGVRA